MNETFEPTLNRRQMLRSGLRYALAAGIAAGSLGLIVRSTRSSGEATCPGRLPCQACARLTTCGLPQAAEALRSRKAEDARDLREERES